MMASLLWIVSKLSRLVDYLTWDLWNERSWVKKVPPALRSGGPSAEEAERPFPGPQPVKEADKIITPDRIASPSERLGLAVGSARARRMIERREWNRKVSEDIAELLARAEDGDLY